jgi:putative transposase
MRINWREQIVRNPRYAQIENWPHIDLYTIAPSHRKQFKQRKTIAHRVLNGMASSEAARLAGVSKSFITYLMKRCLECDEAGSPALTAGLIPGRQIKKPQRRTTMKNGRANLIGARCSFSETLNRNPWVVEQLDKRIIAFIQRKIGYENLTVTRFHRLYLDYLSKVNWPKNCYPFDQDREGFESCRKYYNLRLTALRMPKTKKYKPTIVLDRPLYAYEEIEVDEQKIDVFSSISIELDGALKRLCLPRLHLYVARDVATSCVLATHLCLNSPPKQEDVLELIEKINRKWEPMELTTPGLEYPTGAGFPSMISDDVQNASLGTLKFDNALTHHALAVVDIICKKLGSSLNIGHPACPKHRSIVEHQFSLLNNLTHRFPTTVGSHSRDPKRISSKLSKQPAELDYYQLIEFIDVFYASLNASVQGGSHGHSPLDQIRHQFNNNLMPICLQNSNDRPNAFARREVRNVVFSKKEKRAPNVSYKSIQYKGSCLTSDELIGRKIQIEVDVRDLRVIQAYSLDGKWIGELRAPIKKQNYPLSLVTLNAMKTAQKETKGLKEKAVDGYFDYIFENAATPSENLEVLRVYTELKRSPSESKYTPFPPLHSIETQNPIIQRKSNISKIPRWEDLNQIKSMVR